MSVIFDNEIAKLKKHLLTLGAVVEGRVSAAVRAVLDRDIEAARAVIDGDPEIDRGEVDLEEDCLKLLALHKPVAHDLRFIVAAIKINTDLERIADLAVNIAERAVSLADRPAAAIPFDAAAMSSRVQNMLKNSLDAFVNLDAAQARSVIAMDDAIDQMNRDMYMRLKEEVLKNPDAIDRLIHLQSISRAMERIADHTTNIAEDIIYLVEGVIVRHQESVMGGR
jgi:phosphate transport system protein